jgi:hypothetical protein
MEKILINIDSRFRNIKKYPNPGVFSYFLDEPIKNVTSVRLASIELPTTFYTFLEMYNNTSFIIILNSGIELGVNIKEGNYTSTNMVGHIQSLLNRINTEWSQNFIISWDEIDYKVTISNSSQFTLIFDNDEEHRSLGNRLGYRRDNASYLAADQLSYFDERTNTYRYRWVGDTFLDITKDEYLFVKINDYGVIHNKYRDKSLLAKIILYDRQFVIDNGANFMTKKYNFRQPTNVSRLDIELINTLGATVDMNEIDFSLTLELEQIYDSGEYEKNNFVP